MPLRARRLMGGYSAISSSSRASVAVTSEASAQAPANGFLARRMIAARRYFDDDGHARVLPRLHAQAPPPLEPATSRGRCTRRFRARRAPRAGAPGGADDAALITDAMTR